MHMYTMQRTHDLWKKRKVHIANASLCQNLPKEQARSLTIFASITTSAVNQSDLLDRTSSCPCEEANGPGAGSSRVHHILVELKEDRL